MFWPSEQENSSVANSPLSTTSGDGQPTAGLNVNSGRKRPDGSPASDSSCTTEDDRQLYYVPRKRARLTDDMMVSQLSQFHLTPPADDVGLAVNGRSFAEIENGISLSDDDMESGCRRSTLVTDDSHDADNEDDEELDNGRIELAPELSQLLRQQRRAFSPNIRQPSTQQAVVLWQPKSLLIDSRSSMEMCAEEKSTTPPPQPSRTPTPQPSMGSSPIVTYPVDETVGEDRGSRKRHMSELLIEEYGSGNDYYFVSEERTPCIHANGGGANANIVEVLDEGVVQDEGGDVEME